MGKGFDVSYAQERGPRSGQEDSFAFVSLGPVESRNIKQSYLLAVMDGHGGKEAATACSSEIEAFLSHKLVLDNDSFIRELIQKLSDKTRDFHSGTTVSIVLVDEDDGAIVAIIGDSPVIILDAQDKIHVSPEHNARTNLKERKAAEARGGRYEQGYMYNGNGRTGLQMTRALGDVWMYGIILREPEIYTVLDPVSILVASDGLLDPAHEQTEELMKDIESFAKSGANAEDLMNWARERGLDDNTTAVVCAYK